MTDHVCNGVKDQIVECMYCGKQYSLFEYMTFQTTHIWEKNGCRCIRICPNCHNVEGWLWY